MTTPPWRIVTPKQANEGWAEIKDGVVTHRDFVVLKKLEDGNFVVRNPELILLEEDQ